MLDTFHMNMEENDLPEAIRHAAPHLMHFQANENHRGFLGTGHLDWPTICRALFDIKYPGAITLEPFRRTDHDLSVPLAQWKPPAYDEDDDLRHSGAFLRAALHAVATVVMRIGWIGCGNHAAEMLLPQLVRLPVRLAAICDPDAERLALIGNRYGVTARYADAEALLAHEGLDAVGMAVGPGVHARIGAAAMERGLAVFMEKPPAATAREAQLLADVSARTGKPCVVGFMKRYSTANRIAGNILAAAGFRPARQPARRIHDRAGLFRRQSGLHRLPAASLRACDGSGALAAWRTR